MYFKALSIEDTGPIEALAFEFEFDPNGKPKPTIFVGQNGTGKSLVISHLVNCLLATKSAVFDDHEVEEGKVYKLRSPMYIRRGSEYSLSRVEMDNGIFVQDVQLSRTKNTFEEQLGYTIANKIWTKIGADQTSAFDSNAPNSKVLREDLNSSVCLYFPPNRYEEPAWLNEQNLLNRAAYTKSTNLADSTNRQIINYSPLKQNQDWLLDVIFDSFAIERKTVVVPNADGQPRQFTHANGLATNILNLISQLLFTLFGREGTVSYDIGPRGHRSISFKINNEIVIGNIFSLSTGQTSVLNVLLSIIRDFDQCRTRFDELDDIQGIVVIDEIDAHLHSNSQYNLIPKLISLFPNIQFVITNHSPLVLLGLENVLGPEGISIVELPHGSKVTTEKFSEFGDAYQYFRQSTTFHDEIAQIIEESQLPVVFLEGSTDIDYLKKAAEILDHTDILKNIVVRDANGAGGLKKIAKLFDTAISTVLPQKILLVFDCDTDRNDRDIGNLLVRCLPQLENPIERGIENLFPKKTIERAKDHNPAFIDVEHEHKKLVRGVTEIIPERWSVNENEKRNLCDWICAESKEDDFVHFSHIFRFLKEII